MQDLEALKQWATDRQKEIIDALIYSSSQRKAAESLGISIRALQRALERAKRNAAKHGWSPEHDMAYPAPETHLVKGVSTLYGPNGLVKQQWVKTDLKKEELTECLKQVADELCQTLPRYEPKEDQLTLTTDALTAYVIGDAHVGMLVRDRYNMGQGDWDLKMAENATLSAIKWLVDCSGNTDVGALVDIGDFMHNNDSTNLTQSGNVLDVDGDLSDIVSATVRIYRAAIEYMLEKHHHVVLMKVRGNHDRDAALIINTMLTFFYENEPRVTILDNRHKFMVYEYGKNLLVAHHGDRMKPDRAYQFITNTLSEEWGRTKHRHLLLGHIHHNSSKEIGGLQTESFNTLAPPDQWHSHSGFGSKRSMTAIIFDKEHGEVQRHKVGINQLQ